jgi:hypothetical protein
MISFLVYLNNQILKVMLFVVTIAPFEKRQIHLKKKQKKRRSEQITGGRQENNGHA